MSHSKTHQKRGAMHNTKATFIAAWVPDEIVAALDAEVVRTDSDRSKLLRKALKQLLSRPA